MSTTEIKNGLLKTPVEKQKFSFGGVFGYDLKDLPEEYSLGPVLEIKNQNIPSPSFVCVAESLCSVSEYQEGVALEPAWTIKVISEILGNTSWLNKGTDLATGAKAALKGFLERHNAPHSVEKQGVEYCANSANWDAFWGNLALNHAKQSWFWIGTSGKLKMFDAIRGSMWRFKDEKRAVQTGVMWHYEWTEKYIASEGTPSGAHAICITGWKGEFLKIQNSVGKEIGESGIQWMHKDLVNKLFKFGAIMFADMPFAEEKILKKSAKYRKKKLLERLFNFIKNVF